MATAIPILSAQLLAKRIDMSGWKENDAKKVKSLLSKYLHKKIALYGGGGSGTDIGILEKIVIVPRKRGDGKLVYNVDATIKFSSKKKNPNQYTGNRYFTPHIGSWRIARIE